MFIRSAPRKTCAAGPRGVVASLALLLGAREAPIRENCRSQPRRGLCLEPRVRRGCGSQRAEPLTAYLSVEGNPRKKPVMRLLDGCLEGCTEDYYSTPP